MIKLEYNVQTFEKQVYDLQQLQFIVSNTVVVLGRIHRILDISFQKLYFTFSIVDEHFIDSAYFARNGVYKMLIFVLDT